MLLSRSASGKFSIFCKNGGLFFRSKRIQIGLFSSNSKSAPQKLSLWPDWTEDKRARSFTGNNTAECLTLHLPHSDHVSKIFMELKRFCFRIPSHQVWWHKAKERQRGWGRDWPPAYIITKYPMGSLNKVKCLRSCRFRIFLQNLNQAGNF